MRSRYSAFAVGDPAYLLTSWHRSTRPASLELDASIKWRRLQIVAVSAGGSGDRDGTVEFIAHFWDDARHQHGLQHEHSTFLHEGGQWYYVGVAS